MRVKREGEWIYNDELVGTGLTFADVAILFTLKGLAEPSGFIERKLILRDAYPDSLAHMERLAKIIREGDFGTRVRILPDGSWWFADRCSEKLGKSFNPESKMHIDILTKLINAGIPLSDVPDVYWYNLDKIPVEQLQKLSYSELMELVEKKTSYLHS